MGHARKHSKADGGVGGISSGRMAEEARRVAGTLGELEQVTLTPTLP